MNKIAIIGMACLFPGAPDLASYWSNIVRGFDATREVTDKEWSLADYYDKDAASFGLSYAKRGGFITEFAQFDPLKYGVMPSSVVGSDPDQMLTLKVAQDAMADAGYLTKGFNRDRAEIIIGRIGAPGAGCLNLVQQCKTVNEIAAILRAVLPEHNEELLTQLAAQIQGNLQPVNSDTIPGTMPSVTAGRLAAKLGFRGRNLIIDAACASSMVAVETAVNDLLDKRCDFALAGGVHINSSAVFFQMFCGLGALSHTDSIKPFDQSADGTMLGEGVGMICLKRLEDAEADGDKVYATICGVASSSDGHGGSVIAPSADGEALAMRNAYAMAGISPTTIELLEAHGTGTPAGDVVELQAVEKVFRDADLSQKDLEPWCALGSVKSMIGHLQSASAIAGIIKTTLALHHKILPPTLNVTTPNSKINWAKHPCYVNSQTRPWLKTNDRKHPRRGAVSAFGFGGINAHMILEESDCLEEKDSHTVSLMQEWENEVFMLSSTSRKGLLETIATLAHTISHHKVVLKDLAYTLNCSSGAAPQSGYRLALVAGSSDELALRLASAAEQISDSTTKIISETKKGIYFTAPEALLGGQTAFIYPGLGSAYTNMLGDLCVLFPEIREVFEIVDNIALAAGATERPSKTIFPPPFTAGERTGSPSLAAADFAVVAVLLAEYALCHFLAHLEIKPDAIMGCSTGEFAAITTGGSVDVLSVAQTFYEVSTEVARSLPAESLADLRSLRILAPTATVMNLVSLADRNEVHLSADLGAEHTIVTGSAKAIENLNNALRDQRLPCHLLPVAIPYHTPLVKAVMVGKEAAVRAVDVSPLAIPGWSCSTAERYPDDIEGIRTFFTELFTKPVALRQTIQAMYDQGVRKFIEVGPSGILSSLIPGILPKHDHLAVATNLASKSGLTQIHHLLAALFVQEVPAKLDYLYQRRQPTIVNWQTPTAKAATSNTPLLLAYAGLKIDTSKLPEVHFPLAKQDYSPERNLPEQDRPEQDLVKQDLAEQDLVVQRFLSTNAEFYSRVSAVSEQVMRSYIENQEEQQTGISAGADASVDTSVGTSVGNNEQAEDLPFLKRCQVFPGSDNTELFITLNLDTDLYLLDHAIGGIVSAVENTRVHLVPLMVSLEIMAEAAVAHHVRSNTESGSGVIVRLEQVKAFKRLVVDHNELSLKMTVTGFDDKVHVEMTEVESPETVLMMADYIFARQYSQCCAPQETYLSDQTNKSRLAVSGPAASNLKEHSQLYSPQAMFHGPSMQAVKSLDQVGNKAIAGKAAASPAANWMPNLAQANFLINPLLLDNSSQFVLFYLYEKNLSATALLPFFIESIDFYSNPAALDAEVEVAATLPALTERATEAEVEVMSGGQVALRVNSINSRRVVLSDTWQNFVANPPSSFLGTSILTTELLSKQLRERCAIVQVSQDVLSEDDVILEWCLDYLLTKNELSQWRSTGQSKKRKTDWLLGRIAAKDAVRMLVRNGIGRILGPHDVEIHNHPDRSPYAVIKDKSTPPVSISITHTNGKGIAIASFVDANNAGNPGIDAETISARDSDFASSFMQPSELKHLASCPSTALNTEITRIWTAKESMYKANLGKFEASKFEILESNPDSDLIVISGANGAGKYKAYSQTKNDLVLTYTLSEPNKTV
ncbi:polyketide synthase dehydratase domain-containing protein [bacterium]|nr:polyketide synthase dehydratase domain-containing protein [bacterium]